MKSFLHGETTLHGENLENFHIIFTIKINKKNQGIKFVTKVIWPRYFKLLKEKTKFCSGNTLHKALVVTWPSNLLRQWLPYGILKTMNHTVVSGYKRWGINTWSDGNEKLDPSFHGVFMSQQSRHLKRLWYLDCLLTL